MSQHRPNKNKAANPLQKPWTKTDKAAKPARKQATAKAQPVKAQPAKATKSVQDNETKVYSANACRVLFQQRPESVIRLYISEKLAPKFADVMKYLAATKKAYHIVDDAELEKVAASGHHGGVVMVVKRKPLQTLAQYLQQNGRKRQDCLLALDGVGNAHKIGRPIYELLAA